MDPTTPLTTWQQAFENNPITSTRAIEKQLRASVDRDREKLRGLAGSSYRELLATAEQIVHLDEKTKITESQISHLSQNCRPVPYSFTEHGSTAETLRTRARHVAQIRLLQRCCSCIEVGLRSPMLLLCGQLIALSRLIVKSLGDEAILSKPADLLKARVARLRRRLLSIIDRTITSPVTKTRQLIEALTSYCLVTNSSSADAVKHLQRKRIEKLSIQCDIQEATTAKILDGLRYLVLSLQTIKALHGRSFNDALANLQKQPILDDPRLKELEELQLDQTTALVSEDIRTFTPYFKGTTLSTTKVGAILEEWSQEACTVLCSSLKAAIAREDNLGRLLQIRRELYAVLLPVYFSTAGRLQLDQNLRRTVDGRFRQLCEDHVSRLRTITNEMLYKQATTTTITSVWQSELVTSSLEQGASKFLRQLHRQHGGADVSLARSLRRLQTWISGINTMRFQLDEQKSIRWRDMIEEPDEDKEEESDTLLEELSRNDINKYNKSITMTMKEIFLQFEAAVYGNAEDLVHDKTSKSAVQCISLLRIIREVLIPLQRNFPAEVQTKRIVEIIPSLHKKVASEVLHRLASVIEQKSGRTLGVTHPQHGLPPNLPSPRAFFTLRKLCQILLQLGGTDVWSPAAIRMVKEEVYAHVSSSEHRNFYLETSFDEAYIAIALQRPGTSAKTALKSDPNFKPASEYWSRTKLLFGQLA